MPGSRVVGRCIAPRPAAMPALWLCLLWEAPQPQCPQGQAARYAYYRCLGTDAYRFGGERVCQNTQVRTDLLDVAVWQEVCTLLAHPERLAEEYRRRLQPETRAKRTSLATVEAQIGKLRQGVARLIDSYAEGLIDKDEFEPRITRLRQRLARLEEQRQAGADEAALQTELQLIIGRLEDFATKVHSGLETADWASQRDLIRTLVKRVEVARDQVNIVFRVDPYAGDPDPEKKVCNFVGGVVSPILSNIYLDRLDKFVEDTLIPEYTRGEKREANLAYKWKANQAAYYRGKGNLERAETIRREMQQLPSGNPNDPGYRRLTIHSLCRRHPVRPHRPRDGSRRNQGKNHHVPQHGTETHLISRKNADDACPHRQSKVSRLRNRYYEQPRQVRSPQTTRRQRQSRPVHTRGRHADKAQTVSQGR